MEYFIIAVIGGLLAVLAALIPKLFDMWQETLSNKKVSSKIISNSFELGYSISAAWECELRKAQSQNKMYLKSMGKYSNELGLSNPINTFQEDVSFIELFVSGHLGNYFKQQLKERYGKKPVGAFQLGWVIVTSIFQDGQGRKKAMKLAVKNARRIGLDKTIMKELKSISKICHDNRHFPERIVKWSINTFTDSHISDISLIQFKSEGE